jgi:hypothetical protein
MTGRSLPNGDRGTQEGAVVTDPVVIVLVAGCARGVAQLAEALAQRIVLRACAELVRVVAAAPGCAEVAERDRWGGSIRILVKAPEVSS